jgi:hypothetical protein
MNRITILGVLSICLYLNAFAKTLTENPDSILCKCAYYYKIQKLAEKQNSRALQKKRAGVKRIKSKISAHKRGNIPQSKRARVKINICPVFDL